MKRLVFALSTLALIAAAPAVPPSRGTAAGCANLPLSPSPCALLPLSAAEASAVLAADGYGHVRHLEPIGTYWQGEVERGARRLTVYLLADGEVLQSPPLVGAP
jgi:hypothetical protein